MAYKLKSNAIIHPFTALKDDKIQAIFISSSTSTHIKLILEAAKNKKTIF